MTFTSQLIVERSAPGSRASVKEQGRSWLSSPHPALAAGRSVVLPVQESVPHRAPEAQLGGGWLHAEEGPCLEVQAQSVCHPGPSPCGAVGLQTGGCMLSCLGF